MSAQYSYTPEGTVAAAQSQEGTVAQLDNSAPQTFTFDVPDGSWVDLCVILTAQSAILSPPRPGFQHQDSDYTATIHTTVSLDGSADYDGLTLYGGKDIVAYLGVLPGQPNDNVSPQKCSVGDFLGVSGFSAAGYGGGGSSVFHGGAESQELGSESVPMPIAMYDQGYGCVTSGNAGTLTLTVNLMDANSDTARVSKTIQNLTATLYLYSIQADNPHGTVTAADTSGGAGPPFTGAASVTLPLTWGGYPYNGYCPIQNIVWSVWANPHRGGGPAKFSGQVPDKIEGQGSTSITWSYGNLPDGSSDITVQCTFQNGAYPHEVPGSYGGVIDPRVGAAVTVVTVPGTAARPSIALGHASLSAPGSRFCRAEDAFTGASPPKPAGIMFRRGNGPVPKLMAGTLWEKTGAVVSANPADTSPALVMDQRRLLYCAFTRASAGSASSPAASGDGICVKRSDDYGDTWHAGIDGGSAEYMAIPNGLMPALASKSGNLLLAALSGTDAAGYQVMVCYKGIGDAKFSAAKVAAKAGGAAMTAQKSGLALCHADEAAERWVLSVLLKGETATSEWWSADDGASWTRIPAS